MLTKNDFIEAIRHLNIQGENICVHASISSFGEEIENGSDSILDAFTECECTVMVPTFTNRYLQAPEDKYRPKNNGTGEYEAFIKEYLPEHNSRKACIYENTTNDITVEEMGTFPKALLNRENRIRGKHPLNSFTAIGPHAKELIEQQSFRDVYAPFQSLYQSEGYVLLMGVGLTSATILHYAEMLAGRKPFIRWALDASKEVRPVSVGGCSLGFGCFDSVLKPYEKTLTVGHSLWRLYPLKTMIPACVQAIRENPFITHCGDPDCVRCNDACQGGPVMDFEWPKE